MATVSQITIDWCKRHKLCKGCKFNGGACVAPVSDRDFPAWIEKMNKLIEVEAKANKN